MSVDSLKEAFEAAVPPVQVNPLGDAQAQDDVVLLSLSQQEAIVLQHIIGLRERRRMLEDGWMRRSWCTDAERFHPDQAVKRLPCWVNLNKNKKAINNPSI